MARTHQRIERWDLPADGDQWEAIRAADAYLRRRLGVGKKCHAGVFDARGQIYENDLHMAYEEWQQESSPLRGVVVSYGTRLRTYMRNCSAKTSTGQSNTTGGRRNLRSLSTEPTLPRFVESRRRQ